MVHENNFGRYIGRIHSLNKDHKIEKKLIINSHTLKIIH